MTNVGGQARCGRRSLANDVTEDLPQHFLNLRLDPQQQSSLRPFRHGRQAVRSQEAGNRRPTDAILQVDRPRVTLRVCTGELPQWNAWILLALFDLTCRRQTCLTGTRLRKDARTCVVGATHSSKGSGAWRGLWLKRSGGAPAPSRQCQYPLPGVLRARHPECASAASCSFDGFRLHFGDPGAVACIESHRT